MALMDEIKAFCDSMSLELTEKRGVWKMRMTIAERKAFLSRTKLEYIASFKIDEAEKRIGFTEMLKESGSGVSGGGDFGDSGMAPGFGFKAGTYKTGAGPRQGTIIEQSELFGKKYEYRFDFRTIREQVEAMAESAGYEFFYEITAGAW